MNCQEFESNVDGMARGALMDAGALAGASAHEEVCERCSALLANERALTAGLCALAAGTKGAGAPARVESSLLAAFRADAAAHATDEDESAASPAVAPTPSRGEVVRPWSWTRTVATASLAAAAALAFYMIIPPDFSLTPATRDAGQVAKTNTPLPRSSRTQGGAVETARAGAESSAATSSGGVAQTLEVAGAVRNQRASSPYRPRATNAVYNPGGARAGLLRGGTGASQQAGAREVMTDFIPLAQGGNFAQSDAGHIVRVELPRSALTSFGLPFNAESAGGRVKADVLLGEDGIARAIRFVR